ncbi:hypothetical protein [Sandaracinus amylolyticus]|uniref:Cytochrome c domain-containing protein n=1 Tax=Sandaracinus amylolyticus TaxID=927083 RepID=A0A0F6W1X7_9BACT|nr:hypothetical protein [Sandaracinus amylolyticus]AKF05400.1 Hypothetical protein DB32_002549 [Sandaracinus amylolyticus]
MRSIERRQARTRATLALVATFGTAACGLNANDPYRDAPVVSLDVAPPPISGGTLAASADGRIAVAADPDRDRVLVVDLETHDVRAIDTAPGADPGRVALAPEGRAFVALRRTGAVLEIDVERAAIVAEHAVCSSPRGLAAAPGRLHVACADGALVTLERAHSGEVLGELARVRLEPDLRDVVVTHEGLLVSRFRRAELVLLDDAGTAHVRPLPEAHLEGITADGARSGLEQRYEPGVAVRTTSAPGGRAIVLHQRARIGTEAVFVDAPRPSTGYTYSNEPVENDQGDVWRDPCGNAVVHAAATLVGAGGIALHTAPSIARGVVPVDVAVSEGGRVAIAFAGEPGGEFRLGPQVVTSSLAVAERDDPQGCLGSNDDRRYAGQVIAVAFAGEREVVQLREPARLVVDGAEIELGGASVRDTGHDVFHLDTGGAIACASCHPEGGDDGHVWTFSATGSVRTQSLEGAVGLAPYHRRGDMPSFPVLIDRLQEQMAGPRLAPEVVSAAERWLARLPAPPAGPSFDHDAVERGRAIFERADVGCASCHAGDLGTDGLSHTIGADVWQTPPLRGVALRAPYLHDGRASDLRAALVTHARIEHLEVTELDDLEAYVRAR